MTHSVQYITGLPVHQESRENFSASAPGIKQNRGIRRGFQAKRLFVLVSVLSQLLLPFVGCDLS
jgi:hypothetical protein